MTACIKECIKECVDKEYLTCKIVHNKLLNSFPLIYEKYTNILKLQSFLNQKETMRKKTNTFNKSNNDIF